MTVNEPDTGRVLVAAASRHGATAQIAGRIGETLRRHGLDATVANASEVDTLDGVDTAITEATAPRDHRIFAGRTDRSQLGFAERAIMLAVRAPEGDFRDWEAIERWADGIADALQTDSAHEEPGR